MAPLSFHVGELALLSRRGDEPMRTRATVALGSGEVRWVPQAAAAGGPDALPGAMSAAETRRTGRVSLRVAQALGDAAVHLVGSRRTGCALPGADLDLVAALPGTPELASVRRRLSAALPDATGTREVVGARVPGLRFEVDGLSVDLAVVPTGSKDPSRAVDRRAELGETAAVALSAVSDANELLASLPGRGEVFARLAAQVKAWARARGLDAAPFGGLPGLAWSVLVARTVREAGDLPPDELLRHFFATWAAWDWREAVGGAAHPDLPVTIMTPTAPVRPCSDQVTPDMRDLLGLELFRAWELLEEGGPAGLLDPPELHRRHAAWAVVTVGPGEEGRVRGRMRALLTALTEAGVSRAHAWPRPFPDDPTRYAVGLGPTPPGAAELAALTAPWLKGLTRTTVVHAPGGDVPTLS